MLSCCGGDGQLAQVLQWRNPRCTGPIFVSVLVFLIAVRYLSLLSVVGNLSLALLTATMAFRIYKSVLAAVNKSGEGNPFRVSRWNPQNFYAFPVCFYLISRHILSLTTPSTATASRTRSTACSRP